MEKVKIGIPEAMLDNIFRHGETHIQSLLVKLPGLFAV